MRLGFRSPGDLTAALVDRENDGAISRSATQRARRGPWDHPAEAVDQPHIAADNQQGSFDIRRVSGGLHDKARHPEVVHVVFFPDHPPREGIPFRYVAGQVIEVVMPTLDG